MVKEMRDKGQEAQNNLLNINREGETGETAVVSRSPASVHPSWEPRWGQNQNSNPGL